MKAKSDQPDEKPLGPIRAMVGSIEGKGHRKYIVTFTLGGQSTFYKDTSITVSYRYWPLPVPPERGQEVILGKIDKHVGGWRAKKISPVKPRAR
jgi:hypothetical protein